MKNVLDLVGRIFISFIFLFQAVDSISHATSTKTKMVQYGIESQTNLLFITGIVLMILGGISVLLGYRSKMGATMLLLFLLPSTLTYYFDWSDDSQQILIRNFAIMGGLLMIMANGSGSYSVKRLLAGIK